MKEAINLKESYMGTGHPETADCYFGLGKLYLKYGDSRLNEAETALTQAKQIQKKTLGRGHYKAALTYLVGLFLCRLTIRVKVSAFF